MDWPTWAKFKVPRLKDLGTNSALDPIAYLFLASVLMTFFAAFFKDQLFLKFMLAFDVMLLIAFVFAYFFFAIKDPDRLAPPSHQRYMAKLLRDERRDSGPLIEGALTTNTGKPESRALPNG